MVAVSKIIFKLMSSPIMRANQLAYSLDEVGDKQTSKLLTRIFIVLEARRHHAKSQEDSRLVSEFDILEQKILQEFILNH